MSDPEESLPAKRQQTAPAQRVPAKKTKEESESEGSYEPGEESEEPLPDILSDEGEHGDDSDFDYDEYTRFKEEENKKASEAQPVQEQSEDSESGGSVSEAVDHSEDSD